jgi:hypothetical protein
MDHQRHDDRPAAARGDDLLGDVIITDGPLIERAFDPVVSGVLADADSGVEFVMQQAPAIKGAHGDAEDVGNLDIGRAVAAQPLGDAGEFRFVRRRASSGHGRGVMAFVVQLNQAVHRILRGVVTKFGFALRGSRCCCRGQSPGQYDIATGNFVRGYRDTAARYVLDTSWGAPPAETLIY